MKTLLLASLVAASATTAGSILFVQAQEQPSAPSAQRSAPKTSPSAGPVLPQFLQDEVVQIPSHSNRGARTFTDLSKMHDAYFNDFASKPGFGASRIQFLPPQDYFTLNGETYRFAAPDLLGLEDEPLAYMRPWSETITMTVVSKKESRALLKRRALTAAETRAVAELRAGKELVTVPGLLAIKTEHGTSTVAGLLAVGALRAKTHCAECHQCKEGTLLGAFSYLLVPTNSFAPRTLAVAATSR